MNFNLIMKWCGIIFQDETLLPYKFTVDVKRGGTEAGVRHPSYYLDSAWFVQRLCKNFETCLQTKIGPVEQKFLLTTNLKSKGLSMSLWKNFRYQIYWLHFKIPFTVRKKSTFKVQIFWEGHENLRKSPNIFEHNQ